MDMARNLTAINRLNQIRISNPSLLFKKAHSKQDNIWDKQYPEERRRQLNAKLIDLLKIYPSKEEVAIAWKEGVDEAIKMAHRSGMVEEDTRNDTDWIKDPFKFIQVESMLDEMLGEEEVTSGQRQTDSESASNNEDGFLSFEENEEESVIDENIDKSLINECQNALTQESDSIEDVDQRRDAMFDLKIFVPALNAVKYKSQVVSELAHRGKVSADRLIRVQSSTSTEHGTSIADDTNVVGLFDYIAVRTDIDDEFSIAQVRRMYRLYSSQNGKTRRVEYVKPFDTKTANVDVEFKVIHFERQSELQLNRTEIHSDIPCSSVVQKVTLYYDNESQCYQLSAVDKLSLDRYFSRRPGRNDMADDGRRVRFTYSSRGRQRRTVQFSG
eukprot:Seg17159.1 transcript_id=Seg17159.1/GoldUCD/mRNA.D3Y31 product="hypothetical protein" protein_id=Seg17159.1/GoldUCD/D3Y31